MDKPNNHYTRYAALLGQLGSNSLRRRTDRGYMAALYILAYEEDVFELAQPHISKNGIHFDLILQAAERQCLYSEQMTEIRTARSLFNGIGDWPSPLDMASCDLLTLDILCNAMYIWKGMRTPAKGADDAMELTHDHEKKTRKLYAQLYAAPV